MAIPTFETAEPGCSTEEAFAFHDDVSNRLYNLEHLLRFIGDLAAVGPLNAQVEQIKAESVQVVFGRLADEILSIREAELQQLRKAIPHDREWQESLANLKGHSHASHL